LTVGSSALHLDKKITNEENDEAGTEKTRKKDGDEKEKKKEEKERGRRR